ncbi:MAG: AraC family transcriptional regulator [Clostridia bacterium]|nr:AraC family transcriptional regulator [Clostridia bacterium]
MNNDKIRYLVDQAAELFGLPVRAYRKNEQVAFGAFVPLEADPFTLYEDKLWTGSGSMDWIVTPNYYYAVIRSGDVSFAIGPVAERRSPGRHCALEEAKALNLEEDRTDLLIHQLDALVRMTIFQLAAFLCLMNFTLNGEMLTISDLKLWALNPQDFGFAPDKTDYRDSEKLFQKSFLETKLPREMLLQRLVEGGRFNKLDHYLTMSPGGFANANFFSDPMENARASFDFAVNQAQAWAANAGVNEARARLLGNYYRKTMKTLDTPETVAALRKEMFVDFSRKIGNKEDFFRYRKTVIDAIDYINRHIGEPLDTQTISAQLFVSRSRLSTVFKQDTGQNLSDYIHQQKIEAAKHMLISETRNLASIASSLGYKSQSHFTNVFKKYAGLTPSEYRKRNYQVE